MEERDYDELLGLSDVELEAALQGEEAEDAFPLDVLEIDEDGMTKFGREILSVLDVDHEAQLSKLVEEYVDKLEKRLARQKIVIGGLLKHAEIMAELMEEMQEKHKLITEVALKRQMQTMLDRFEKLLPALAELLWHKSYEVLLKSATRTDRDSEA